VRKWSHAICLPFHTVQSNVSRLLSSLPPTVRQRTVSCDDGLTAARKQTRMPHIYPDFPQTAQAMHVRGLSQRFQGSVGNFGYKFNLQPRDHWFTYLLIQKTPYLRVCKALKNKFQTDNHASNPPLSFFTDRVPFLPPNQQRQSTEGIRCSD